MKKPDVFEEMLKELGESVPSEPVSKKDKAEVSDLRYVLDHMKLEHEGSGRIALRGTDKHGNSWIYLSIDADGSLTVYSSVGKQTGLNLDERGRLIVRKN